MTVEATDTATRVQVQAPSMYKVVFHNDDFTPMQFVIDVIMKVFGKSEEEAYDVATTVHVEGKSPIGLFTKEIANTKVSIVLRDARAANHPLLATAEPA